MMRIIFLNIVLLLSFTSASGQYRLQILPRLSPDKMVYQKIGYTEAEIKYGSPRVKGRKVFGNLVPYNEIWRTGANEATTLHFSDEVEIDGNILPAGKYSFFLIPRKNEKWTAIINKVSDQWGAYSYSEAEDQLRFDILPRTSSKYFEELTFGFEQINFHYARMVLNWDSVELAFEIKSEFEQNLANNLDLELVESPSNTHWVLYLQAAEFLVNENRNLPQAKAWLEKSQQKKNLVTTEWNHQYYPVEFIEGHLYWTLAKLAALEGKYSQAVGYSEKLRALTGEVSYYRWEKEAENIDKMVENWKSKY